MTKNKDKAMRRRSDDDQSVMERHAQTVIGAIIIGLILWVGNTVTQNQKQIAEMTVKIAFMVDKINTLEARLSMAAEDRYKGKEALLAHGHLQVSLDRLSDRIKVLENVDKTP